MRLQLVLGEFNPELNDRIAYINIKSHTLIKIAEENSGDYSIKHIHDAGKIKSHVCKIIKS